LFGENPNWNLITVPACCECNNSTSKDDEYFRLIALDIGASEVPAAQRATAATLRALNRPQARGFCKALYRTLQPVELLSPSGLFIADTFTMLVNMVQLLRTVDKSIRGLFFHHKGYPVLEGDCVWCDCMSTINEAGVRTYHEQNIPVIKDTPIVEVGERVFRYRWGCQGDIPDIKFFQLGFYELIDFIGFTLPIGDDSQAAIAGPAGPNPQRTFPIK
jgi:hypothetical protein